MTVSAAIALLIALLDNAASISALIQKAQGEGRDLTAEELGSIVSGDDAARAALVAAIAAAKPSTGV